MSVMNQMEQKNRTMIRSTFSIRSLAIIGLLSALASVLMLFEIRLWFAPQFYKLDFSEVPVFIGAFALGPIAGMMIELIKILVNFVLDGTETIGVGELANIIIGCSFVLPGALIYNWKKTKKGAILGLIAGTITMTTIGSLLNAFVLLPFYAKVSGLPIENLIAMGTAVNANITNMSTFILWAVAPFNLFKGISVSIITIVLYKRLSRVIKSITN